MRIPSFRKRFNVEAHLARRERLRARFLPRLEQLECRVTPTVTITRTGATDYGTIQNALNNTVNGDTVNISPASTRNRTSASPPP